MNCSKAVRTIRMLSVSFAAVATLSLSACVRPSPRTGDANADFTASAAEANQPAATFYNEEVTGGSIVSKNLAGFSIPSERQFTFKSCIYDKRTRESIKGHSFTISGGAADVTVRSEESGCLNWSEKIAFNGVMDSKYIALKRVIKATGMHSGARNLAICINPWNYDGSEAVRDCARRPVPDEMLLSADDASKYVKGQSKAGESIPRFLWVDDLRMNSVHNPGGADAALIDFSISIGPKVLMRNLRGEDDPLTLKDGKFSVQLWIVAKTGIQNGRCMIIAKSDPTMELAMVTGRLREELKMRVRYISTYGQLELAGIITPKDGGELLRPYNGLWTLGDHTGLLGMKWGFERPPAYKGEPGSFDAKKYVDGCIDVSDGVKESDAVKLISAQAMQYSMTPGDSFESLMKYGVPSAVFTGGGPKIVGQAVGGKVQIELPAGMIKLPADRNGSNAPMIANVPQDLMQDACITDPNDLVRLFPLDHAKKAISPGKDILTCPNKTLPSGIARVEQFEFSPVDVRPEPIMDPVDSETTTERTMKYRVTTTVTNPLAQNQVVRDMEFMIETGDGETRPVRTNHLGQLIFNDTIHHIYFSPERFYLKLAKISHPSGFSKRLAIVLVPWDNNGFQFARDIRGLTKQTIAQMNLVQRPPSQMLLTNYNWGTIGFRYQVDNFLSLKIYKQYMLTLDPRVLRYSSFTHGRMMNEPLRDGLYLMKVAIQRDYQPLGGKPLEYVTGIRTLVAVRAGRINVPVEMMFRDFKVLKLRSNLLIELATIDEKKLPIEIRRAAFNMSVQATKDATETAIQDANKEFYKTVKDFPKVKMQPLDTYIAPSSGLSARTFVGAVVPYSNGFSAAVRGTDELAEVSCPTGNTVDCDELKSSDEIPPSERSERAKLYGDIKHLFKMSVSQLLERQTQLEAKYVREMSDKTKLSELLRTGNLEYAGFQNENDLAAITAKSDPDLSKANEVFSLGSSARTYVKHFSGFKPERHLYDSNFHAAYRQIRYPNQHRGVMNQAPEPQKTAAELVNELRTSLFDTGELTRDHAIRLCIVMLEDVILRRNQDSESSLSFGDRAAARMRRSQLNDLCVRYGLHDPYQQAVTLERKLRVKKLYDFERGGGNLMSLNVGASTSFDRSDSFSFSYGLNPVSVISGALSFIPGGFAKFLDMSGVSMNVQRSKSQGTSEGVSVGSGANIAVELRRMDLTLETYERCTIMRLSNHIAVTYVQQILHAMESSLSQEEKLNRISRGVLWCEGVERNERLKVSERYYQFSQPLGDEVVNDPTALENQPYLLGLRGRSDYIRFIRSIEARPISLFDLPQHISVGELPNDRLMTAFGDATPTHPGLITVEPNMLTTVKPWFKTEDLPKKAK